MNWRPYNPLTDLKAVRRIWDEVGWIDPSNKEDLSALDHHLAGGEAIVAELNGDPECLVITMPATLQYSGEELQLSVVSAVTTSRVARRQGLAGRLTARAIARDAEQGALVSALGIFEQGFYDKLGFGSWGYDHFVSFDPADLKVDVHARPPLRLSNKDCEQVHESRLTRKRGHGSISLLPPEFTRAEMDFAENGFGLGYADGEGGGLSHLVWLGAKETENGPYSVHWMTYRTGEQFLELMGLLKQLGDQVRLMKMTEPPGVQFQDLIATPIRRRWMSRRSGFETEIHSFSYRQARICNLPGCLERTRIACEDVRFNLELSDPIERFLPSDSAWRGVGGNYIVTLGATSSAWAGAESSLPTIRTTVNAFTRLWMGVATASGLAVTDSFAGPTELLERLDAALRLPCPVADWEF